MIQFNLLPDVKIEFIKAKRMKRMVLSVSTIVVAASLAILVLLFGLVNIVQKQHMNNLSGDIKERSKKLEDTPDISKILTIQNQLLSLDDAHNKKPVVSRVQKYIEQVTPNNVSISNMEIDFSTNTATVTGTGKQLVDINKFVDTLKFTKYTLRLETPELEDDDASENEQVVAPPESEEKNAFAKVVLSSFGRSEVNTTYTIEFEFDPLIFDATSEVNLKVPAITTTRSELEKPADLFQSPPLQPTQQGGR